MLILVAKEEAHGGAFSCHGNGELCLASPIAGSPLFQGPAGSCSVAPVLPQDGVGGGVKVEGQLGPKALTDATSVDERHVHSIDEGRLPGGGVPCKGFC